MRKSNYNRLPSTKIEGTLSKGWEEIGLTLNKNIKKSKYTIAYDLYTGVNEQEVEEFIQRNYSDALLINTRDLFKSEEEIKKMTQRYITNDTLFGYITTLTLDDYIDEAKLSKAQAEINKNQNITVIYGCGANKVTSEIDTLVYIDMARWEIQQRFRRKEAKALGIDNSQETPSSQYKRGYFNDWIICDNHKREIYDQVDYWIDTHVSNSPKMIDRNTFFKGIQQTISGPFRVVPFFDPAPWGGQWMKKVCGLDPEKENYGWCFDCVPEENSLYLNIEGENFEMPSVNLVYLMSRELLGEPVEARFGKEFPIRFDLLDTFDGGNLSLQVHPVTQFVRDEFGLQYTQDESYYMLDAEDDATVYLGLKKDISNTEMIQDLKEAQNGKSVFDAEKYVNRLHAKKHDHYLIPGGTVHCSGKNSLVLEISSTPNLFTFKLWDWQRLGLDGKPRPINIDRGNKVIDWKRDTDYVHQHLANQVTIVDSGKDWREERTGLHPNEFIETRRHWFSGKVLHCTNDSVNVLNLVEGEEAIVESPTNAFEPYVVHYAETFIIPASVGEYTITPFGKAKNKECATIKAYIRF